MENVNLINPAFETAKQVKQLLKDKQLLTANKKLPQQEFFVSDDPEKFRRIGGNILNRNIMSIDKIDIEDF